MFEKQRHVFVYNKTRETFLAFKVKVADSILGRLVGLLGRRSLQPDSGVWIVPANAIHTIGMLFSFDLVLIDKDFKVVGLRELVRPFRVTWPERHAESVLELPAHTIFRSRTQIGDQLLIERYEAKKPVEPGISAKLESIPPGEEQLDSLAARTPVVPIAPQSESADTHRSSFLASKNRQRFKVLRAIRQNRPFSWIATPGFYNPLRFVSLLLLLAVETTAGPSAACQLDCSLDDQSSRSI